MNADDGNTYLAPLNRHRDVEADAGGRRDGFEGSAEWRWTKRTCAGLFRELGRCYDEVWFPTVIKEWSALYYQCNHEADYWRYLDEWTVGDPRVRDAVWLEILTQRSAYDRQREDRQQHLRDTGNAESMHVDDEQAQKVNARSPPVFFALRFESRLFLLSRASCLSPVFPSPVTR